MDEKDTTTAPKKITTFAILAFLITLFLCFVEMGWVDTPIDALLQRGSAIFGVLAKPLLALKKFIF